MTRPRDRDADALGAANPAASPGKRVGGYLYVHRSALTLIVPGDARKIDEATACIGHDRWNVAKIGRNDVSLLLYEDFDSQAFPALLTSDRVELPGQEVASRDYRDRGNPPILHRKETLLRPDDPRVPHFSTLTKQAEAFGLFEDVKTIGTRRRWMDLIESRGLELLGHRLSKRGDGTFAVERHRTALARHDLSQPMSLMRRLGIIADGISVFDYGCGQGDDVAALLENGIDAFGWDPHHAPEGPRRPGDVVNLGFVINVIEEPHERVETIKAAWSFARRVIVVSVMTANKAPTMGLTPYRDGYLTKRGTFQRYFAQDDLRDVVHAATGQRAISLAPGIVAVFRDKDLEQEVAFRRRSRAQQLADRFVRRERPVSTRLQSASPSANARIGDQLESLRRLALDFGRLPDISEVPQAMLAALTSARVSFERAVSLCREPDFLTALREAANARRDDLLVYFAMTLFPGVPKYATLPRSLQRDVRTFFGSHANVINQSTKLLFSAGDPASSQAAVEEGARLGLGGTNAGVFRFRPDVLDRLPISLRILVGCAEVIHADLSDCDFIELHPAHKRVRAFRCHDAVKPLPRIEESAEVDLVRLRSRRCRPSDAVLYLKSAYMRLDDPQRIAQAAVDYKLLTAGIIDESGRGPKAEELSTILRSVSRT